MEYLDQIKKENIPDQVFHMLRKSIVAGCYRSGDKLPSENELAEKLCVSRASIKIALQKLCVLGLIETRVGDGSYVKEFDVGAYFDHVSDLLLGPQDLDDIAEYRSFFEAGCARLAMENAKEEDFSCLEQIVGRMEQAVSDKRYEEYANLDYLFHFTICKATKNKIFVLSYQTIGELIFQFTAIKNQRYFELLQRERVVDTHRLILQAIKDKDLEKCIAYYDIMFHI